MTRPRAVTAVAGIALATAALAAGACAGSASPRDVLVRANDYAFTVPESLPAGPTAFGLTNEGKVPHEVIIAGLESGATLSELMRLDRADSSWKHLRKPASGILVADPGVTVPGRILVDLEAGRDYLLVCNFQDSDTSAVHFHKGMVKVVRAYAP